MIPWLAAVRTCWHCKIIALAVTLSVVTITGFGQVKVHDSLASYESLFRQMLQLKDVTDIAAIPQRLQSSIPDALAIIARARVTTQELRILSAVATEWQIRDIPIKEALSSVVFEARMQAVESGESAASLRQRVGTLQTQHDQLLLDYVQLLRTTIGDVRFDSLDANVRTPPRQSPAPRPKS